ncbi:MAG: type II toxin-antitoxin system VapC family toxin [Candidatus Limnocylindrales bacterium]
MTIFVDTTVLMYAAGAEHPLREPCRRIVEAIGSRRVDATTSTEVIQEILHRGIAIRRVDASVELANRAMDLFAPVLPITHALMRRLPDLVRRYPGLDARDLVHVATCIHEAIPEIVSADREFDKVAEVRRIDPSAFAAMAESP